MRSNDKFLIADVSTLELIGSNVLCVFSEGTMASLLFVVFGVLWITFGQIDHGLGNTEEGTWRPLDIGMYIFK